jgi:two-component system cell cycle response regulator
MGARILVVDDNRANLELMLYLLRAFGHECDYAASAPAGLEKIVGGSYDLALVDILMPGMDGFEFARRSRGDARSAGVPLVAVTALAMPGDAERIKMAGFAGYIAKPIDPERFVDQIAPFVQHAQPTGFRQHESTGDAAMPAARSGPTVLAVDDLQTNLDVLRATLVPFGYTVAEAHNVREALDFLERTIPAAIVCDLHMPDEGGFALIERVRQDERWRDIPFAFLSSTAWQTTDRRRGIELGARKFILRPIDPRRLRGEIDELIARADDTRR